jgi:2-dehydropantoate 2-reductase
VTTGAGAPILVMGAGSVGCWIGGALAAAGAPVVFVGRPRVLDALAQAGLTLSDLDGRREHLAPASLRLAAAPPAGLAPRLVLFTVKSGATTQAAAQLAATLPPATPVLSLQNGIGNTERARAAAPGLVWLPGLVPYNIAELGPGQFHRGTGGALAAEDHAALRAAGPDFERARLKLKLHADLRALQWGKLLMNLNNPVNALSGLPLRAQLLDRGFRVCLAALQAEALAALKAAGIEPAQVGALPPRRVPLLLKLPTPVFKRIAARMLRIDDAARSSMADDLRLGRPTEIDAFCGEVVRLAAAHGASAPRNAAISELVTAWNGQPMASKALRRALGV